MWNTRIGNGAHDAVRTSSEGVTLVSSYLEPVIRAVLLIYVAVLPFKALLIVERNGFLVLLGLLLIWCLTNGRLFYRKTPYDVALLAFVLWVGFTVPFSIFPGYSVKEYGRLLQWMVVLYATLFFFGTPPYRRMLVSVIGMASFVAVFFGLTQLNVATPQLVVGTFPAEVWFTTFLVMVIPFGLVAALGDTPPLARRLGALLALVGAVCLIDTQSRAGLVALLGELLAMAWMIRTKRAKLLMGILTGLLITAIVAGTYMKMGVPLSSYSGFQGSIPVKTDAASIVHRFDIWRFTLSEIAKHWLVGIGFGGDAYLHVYGHEGETVEPGHTRVKEQGTHNIFLYLSLHVGIIGMVLFVWFYLSVIRNTLKEYWTAGDWTARTVLGGAVVSMIGLFVRLQFDQMFVGTLATLFWVLLAVAIMHYPSWDRATSESRPG
ncbi:MAG TPA: O-antigen ligase family protein [Nitrospira sp.]|nr:O-antigen ligase family protein [Nitrospira sp.]